MRIAEGSPVHLGHDEEHEQAVPRKIQAPAALRSRLPAPVYEANHSSRDEVLRVSWASENFRLPVFPVRSLGSSCWFRCSQPLVMKRISFRMWLYPKIHSPARQTLNSTLFGCNLLWENDKPGSCRCIHPILISFTYQTSCFNYFYELQIREMLDNGSGSLRKRWIVRETTWRAREKTKCRVGLINDLKKCLHRKQKLRSALWQEAWWWTAQIVSRARRSACTYLKKGRLMSGLTRKHTKRLLQSANLSSSMEICSLSDVSESLLEDSIESMLLLFFARIAFVSLS